MRDVVHRDSIVVVNTSNYADPPSICFSGYDDSNSDSHVQVRRGRSDLITTQDHIRPTYYHRYDLRFEPGRFGGQTKVVASNRKCYRSSQRPKTQYFNQLVDGSGSLGVHMADALTLAYCTSTFEPTVGLQNINTAISNALANARQDVADLGEAALGSKQSAKNLIDRVAQMCQALLHAKNRNWKAMRKTLGISRGSSNLPNAYLEYTYGWKPLVNDIISLVDDMGDGFRRTNSFTVKGFSSDVQTPNPQWTTTRFCEVGLVYKVTNSQSLGFQSYGLSNPLLTGWQALRYSFLIDWIIPIGKYLQGLQGIAGTEYVGGYQLEVCKGSGKIPINRFGWSATGSGKTFVMKRRYLAAPPRPGIHVSLKLSPTRALNLLALLAQRR